jgi:hypothetical protein
LTRDPYKLKTLGQCLVKGKASVDQINGSFLIPFTDEHHGNHTLGCIATDGAGWEHVSVTDQTPTRKSQFTTPSWEMMCRIKRAFWDDDETVIQLHVPQVEWVNDHPGCLHLWKPIGIELPRPPALLVGIIQE